MINLHKSGMSNVAIARQLQIDQMIKWKTIIHFQELKITADKSKPICLKVKKVLQQSKE